MMTGPANDNRIFLHASKPFMPGKLTSKRIKSGCSSRTAAIASCPPFASTTS
jgi:hypothetical protein